MDGSPDGQTGAGSSNTSLGPNGPEPGRMGGHVPFYVITPYWNLRNFGMCYKISLVIMSPAGGGDSASRSTSL